MHITSIFTLQITNLIWRNVTTESHNYLNCEKNIKMTIATYCTRLVLILTLGLVTLMCVAFDGRLNTCSWRKILCGHITVCKVHLSLLKIATSFNKLHYTTLITVINYYRSPDLTFSPQLLQYSASLNSWNVFPLLSDAYNMAA